MGVLLGSIDAKAALRTTGILFTAKREKQRDRFSR